jgi:FMN phosphatase YigB (HAD superfamily)
MTNARRLGNAIAWHRPDLLSLDCFDTLLLRGTESEEERVRRLAVRIAGALLARGIRRDPHSVASTRLAAARAEYRASAREEREARHSTILDLQCLSLGLDQSFVAPFVEAEIEQETHDLRPNLRLAKLMRQARGRGTRVIVVSDMYLPATAILRLLENAGIADGIDRVYSSSDHGRTKRAGGLFDVVLATEGVRADRMLHAGDCRVGDLEAPRRRGVAAVRLPRPHLTLARSVRRAGNRIFGEPANV